MISSLLTRYRERCFRCLSKSILNVPLSYLCLGIWFPHQPQSESPVESRGWVRARPVPETRLYQYHCGGTKQLYGETKNKVKTWAKAYSSHHGFRRMRGVSQKKQEELVWLASTTVLGMKRSDWICFDT